MPCGVNRWRGSSLRVRAAPALGSASPVRLARSPDGMMFVERREKFLRRDGLEEPAAGVAEVGLQPAAGVRGGAYLCQQDK